MLVSTIVMLNGFILIYLVIFSAGYTFLLLMSVRNVLLRFEEVQIGDVLDLMHSHALPPVTVIIAAYNEEEFILETVNSVLKSTYEKTHIMIVSDGSTDQTLPKLIETYELYKIHCVVPSIIKGTSEIFGYYISNKYHNITLIDKAHRCKSDSLNIGLNACRTPFFITVDADSIVEPDAISELVFYMMTREHAVAVGGSIYILNSCDYGDGEIKKEILPRKYVEGVQACEYLRSFLFNRAGWNPIQGALSYSGTATLFEHKAILDIGGFDLENPSNDFEVIINLHAQRKHAEIPYQIGFSAAAGVWTDVPVTLRQFWNQRTNWQIGMMRSLLRHKYMLFNSKYGLVGLFHYPFYLFGETLGAVVEFAAYVLLFLSWYLGIFSTYVVILFFVLCLGFITLLTIATVLMNLISYNKYGGLQDLSRILFYVLTEPIGFRQFSVVCRVLATIKYFFIKREAPDTLITKERH
ncbi:MAG: glycosyltransferase family 2 protein [Gammaproteobacteria bacterium]|nr:glycosyltransferase family 2 protein [Gammaproteobacteria bacterium]